MICMTGLAVFESRKKPAGVGRGGKKGEGKRVTSKDSHGVLKAISIRNCCGVWGRRVMWEALFS